MIVSEPLEYSQLVLLQNDFNGAGVSMVFYSRNVEFAKFNGLSK